MTVGVLEVTLLVCYVGAIKQSIIGQSVISSWVAKQKDGGKPIRSVSGLMCLWCTLLVFVLTNIPFPVPSSLGLISPDGPFPCQGHGCGCGSALQCWTSCCCYDAAQRAQWAMDRRVVPPDYAVVESNSECDSAHNDASCCTAKRSCSSSKSEQKPESKLDGKLTSKLTSKQSLRKLGLMLACPCRGGSTLMTTLPWSNQPPDFLEACIEVPSQWVAISHVLDWEGGVLSPAEPPPRSAA